MRKWIVDKDQKDTSRDMHNWSWYTWKMYGDKMW